jgi:hypothetical protein
MVDKSVTMKLGQLWQIETVLVSCYSRPWKTPCSLHRPMMLPGAHPRIHDLYRGFVVAWEDETLQTRLYE